MRRKMRRAFKLVGVLILFMASLSTTGCWLFPRFRQPVFNLADAVVQLPGAIVKNIDQATSSYVSSRTSAEVIASVQGIYTPVRDNYNEIAFTALEFTRDLLDQIDSELFGNPRLMNELEESGRYAATGRRDAWLITRDVDNYSVQGWVPVADGWGRNVRLDFTVAGGGVSGEVVATPDPSDVDSPLFRIVFDSADSDQDVLTTLEVVNLGHDTDLTYNIPTKLWLSATADGEVFQIAASVYYTEVNLEDGQEAQVYINDIMNSAAKGDYAADDSGITGLYQYRGTFQVNAEHDRGIIDLALVPGYTDPSIDEFLDFSVGAIWKEAIADWVKATPSLITDINFYANPDINSGSTTGEVFTALEQVQTALGDGESSDLDNILFVVLLTNPAYFDSQEADSFVGTADLNQPAWATEIADILATPKLTIAADQATLPDLTIDFGDMAAAPPSDG